MASLKDLAPQYLHTARLTLELYNHSPEHYACLLAVMNTPTSHARNGDYGIRTPAQFDALNRPWRLRDARFVDGVADADLYYLIRLGPNSPEGKLIGGVSLAQRRVGQTWLPPDPGWCLEEAFMGRGYATEAAKEVLRWAREDFGVQGMMVLADEGNQQSKRVAEKLGFVLGGRMPDVDFPGQMYNVLVLPGTEVPEVVREGGAGMSMFVKESDD